MLRTPRRRLALVGAVAAMSTTAGVLVSGTTAWAFSVSGAATVTAAAPSTLSPGVVNQALPNVTVSFAGDAGTSVWSNGDTLTFELWDATSNAELSNTTANSQERASLRFRPTVKSNVAGISTSIALATGPTSSVSDEFVLTFGQDAAKNTATTTFTISNLVVDLGSKIPSGHDVQFKVTASNGTPFTGGTATKFVDVGALPSLSATTSTMPTAPPGTVSVTLGDISVKDLAGGTIQNGDTVTVTLSSGKWSKLPSATGKPTTSGASGLGTSVLSFTASSTSVTGDILHLSGGRIDLAVNLGAVKATIADGANAVTVLVATSIQQLRIGGTDRYSTAAGLFDNAFSTTTSVVLTSGVNYPDALSAALLANQFGTGVLTTDPNTLVAATKQQIISHGVDTVFVVGGEKAVSPAVVAAITALHIANNPARANVQVIRIGGADRFATNAMVDHYNVTSAATAIVATGENFADALAVGPAIVRTGYPLVLTASASLSTSAQATLTSLHVQHVIILGGTSAVSSAVESTIKGLGIAIDYRIAGTDRTETAAGIAQWETDGLAASGSYPALGGLGFGGTAVVDLARGDSFADALVAGVAAGKQQTVLLLSSNPLVLGLGAVDFLAGRLATITGVRAVGLTSALSAGVLGDAAGSIN